MQEKLGELKLNTLMEKFGAGGHKPGAGSAAALQGMIAAKLLKTVIELTKSKNQYQHLKGELEKKEFEIENEIYPNLYSLMQEDSEQFDKVINLREKRDKEKNVRTRSRLAFQSLQEQKIATDIPVQIANNCIRLANHAIFVFDNGFKSARGDSSVAINCAVSAIGGCLAIIDLNLLSFGTDEWTESVRTDSDLMKTAHANLIDEASQRQEVLNHEAAQLKDFHFELNSLLSESKKLLEPTNKQIEDIVRKLQNTIWKHKKVIWKRAEPKDLIGLINSKKIFKNLGFQLSEEPNLDYHNFDGDQFEVAGVIDGQEKYVSISGKFNPEVRNFTLAHELGHALLHQGQSLHRDMPIDGSKTHLVKDKKEKQADRFAAYFLMPGKLVKDAFFDRFKTNNFEVNQVSAAAFGITLSKLREKCKVQRDLSRLLAETTFYSSTFESLCQQFKVSKETMAIRIEELGLIKI